jgi:zinc transporter
VPYLLLINILTHKYIFINLVHYISVQRHPLKTIYDIKQRIDTQDRCPKDAGDFLTMLVHRILERMSHVLSDLDPRLDDIEEEIIDQPSVTMRERIANIRRQALILKRYIAPQRDVLGLLKLTDVTFWKSHHKRGIQESYDQNTKYVEDLDEIRERGTIVKYELANSLSDRINKNMYIL